MIQTCNPHTPLTASSHAARQGQILAVVMLALFYVVHNVGTVLFHARGVSQKQTGAALAGYFAGILIGALLLAFMERREAWRAMSRAGRSLRFVFLGVLVFPSLFSQVSLPMAGYVGTPLLNTFQPMLWSMHLPVAMLFFSRYVRPERQALFFGVAISAGHLCWSLLMPLISSGAEAIAVAGLESRYLPLLNLTRNLTGAAFAVLCWKLAEPEASQTSLHGRKSLSASYSGPHAAWPVTPPGPFPARRFFLLLLPFLACSFFNGFAGYLFFPRLLGRGLYPEYMHLALVLLFPLFGMLLTRRGDAALFRLVLIAVLSFAVFPLLLFLPGSAAAHWLVQAAYLICAAMQQVLLFCGVLIFSRFAQFSRVPALVVSAAWLAAIASMPGRFLAAKLLPTLGIPDLPVACLLAALCAFSLLVLRRAFPLPKAPVVPEIEAQDDVPPATPLVDTAKPETPRLEAETKLQAFAAVFGLSAREVETLSRLARKEEILSIAAAMDISERTVRFHLTNILKKTNLPSRQRLGIFFSGWKY